ncbi:MAG: hypothetical protein D6727_04695 [Gammaproteobacteria bacterium]|nr:MAG: hypothetical protein D6727_04695 [Gammaproteobacteria bacterium]
MANAGLPAGGAPAALPEPPRFRAYRELGPRPNIIVDGAPLASTVLTLSHWPNNRTPEALKRDTSTETVYAYLDAPRYHRSAPWVSNNHFDEDGLFSMFALCDPETALTHRELLTDASRAGDFGVFASREAARLCFAVEGCADPDRSPLPAATFAGCERQRTARLYPAMLDRLPRLLADLPGHRALWEEQDRFLADSLAVLAAGEAQIEELPELDLALVWLPEEQPLRTARRYLRAESCALHPYALNTATARTRLLLIQGQRYELQLRYEGWVQLASRRPAPRVALEPLAARLNERERAPGDWRAEPVSEVLPRLYLDGTSQSSLASGPFIDLLLDYLRSAPPAWDPYDCAGSGSG